MLQKEVPMNLVKKQILINNFRKVEYYLNTNVCEEIQLTSLELRENLNVAGVKELLELIPDGYYPIEMKKFYEKTGLKLQVEVYNSRQEVVCFDKEGRYPREDAALWNEDFMRHMEEHPEWLEPQEEPDILIRYIFPLDKSLCVDQGRDRREKIHITMYIN